MQVNNRDAGSLWDMVNAIYRIQEFTMDLTYEAYLDSVLVQSAVERQFEILGEAARRLSDEFRQAHLEIDWRKIIVQRFRKRSEAEAHLKILRQLMPDAVYEIIFDLPEEPSKTSDWINQVTAIALYTRLKLAANLLFNCQC